MTTTLLETKEFRIDVPWGHLAGKSWGNENNEIVLVFHGMLDNAGSFDLLIPHFPSNFCYKVFDLPGHGRSSHFPSGLPIHTIDYALAYRVIVEYFKQESYIFIGHSYGAQLAIYFTQIYPQYAKKIVLLDTYALYPVPQSYYAEYYRNVHSKHFDLLNKLKTKAQPTYTYEEALKKLTVGRNYGDVTTEAALALFERATEKTADGRYKFTLDQRLKNFINPQNDLRQLVSLLKKYPIKVPLLMVSGSDSFHQYNYFKPVINEFRKNKNCVLKTVDGNHNVHMNSPEVVGAIVHKFLLYNKNKL